MSGPIFLVSCVAEKAAQACPAQDLYLSPLFRKARAYVEQRMAREGGRWFILSAWHGLLDPQAVIEPYELTLNKLGAADRSRWTAYVDQQLGPLLEPHQCIVMLAGMRYREGLVPMLETRGCEVEVPMKGLQIGHQLSWLNKALGI